MTYETLITAICVIAAAIIIYTSFRIAHLRNRLENAENAQIRSTHAEAALARLEAVIAEGVERARAEIETTPVDTKISNFFDEVISKQASK
jgi:hypothetical protein